MGWFLLVIVLIMVVRIIYFAIKEAKKGSR